MQSRARPVVDLLALLALLAVTTTGTPRLRGSETEVSLRLEQLGLESAANEQLRTAIADSRWLTAEDILFKAASRSPRSANRLRALGIAHFQAGRHFSAATALKRSDALAPLDPEARFLLASSFIRIQRLHWARAELERLIQQDGEPVRYKLVLAQVHYDQGQFSAALFRVDQILASAPELAAAHDLRGICLEGLGRSAAAVEAFERAIALNREAATVSAWPHYHLGTLLHDLGDLAAAEQALAAALTADSTHAPAQRELGIVYAKANKLRQAAQALEVAAQLAPRDASVHYSLVTVYRRLGQASDAVAAMDRFRELAQ